MKYLKKCLCGGNLEMITRPEVIRYMYAEWYDNNGLVESGGEYANL